jgi:hypothetical protein
MHFHSLYAWTGQDGEYRNHPLISMDIDRQLHLPTLNIHTELQPTPLSPPQPHSRDCAPPPDTPVTEVRGDTVQRSGGVLGPLCFKINGRGLKRDWRFGKIL